MQLWVKNQARPLAGGFFFIGSKNMSEITASDLKGCEYQSIDGIHVKNILTIISQK